MTWTKLDDIWFDDPRRAVLTRDALLLELEALVFSNKLLLDGVVPERSMRRLTGADDPDALAAELVDAELWEPLDSGWRIVYFHEAQESAGDVRRRQELTRTRQARHRAHNAGDHSLCSSDHCSGANASRNALQDASRDAPVTRETTPTRPARPGPPVPPGPTRPSPAAGDGEAAERARDEHGMSERELFDAFWSFYPKRVGRDAAWTVWQDVTQTTPGRAINEALLVLQPSLEATEPRFVPNPATWLREGRWQDDPPRRTAREPGSSFWDNPISGLGGTDERDDDPPGIPRDVYGNPLNPTGTTEEHP